MDRLGYPNENQERFIISTCFFSKNVGGTKIS